MRTYLLLFAISACALHAEEAARSIEPYHATDLKSFQHDRPQKTMVCPTKNLMVCPTKNLWRASITALAVANALDIHSSWGKHELNSTLSGPTGNFGRQGALIKLGFQGGLMGLEYLITRGHPSGKLYRKLAIINFGAAGVIGSVAAHNYSVPRGN